MNLKTSNINSATIPINYIPIREVVPCIFIFPLSYMVLWWCCTGTVWMVPVWGGARVYGTMAGGEPGCCPATRTPLPGQGVLASCGSSPWPHHPGYHQRPALRHHLSGQRYCDLLFFFFFVGTTHVWVNEEPHVIIFCRLVVGKSVCVWIRK